MDKDSMSDNNKPQTDHSKALSEPPPHNGEQPDTADGLAAEPETTTAPQAPNEETCDDKAEPPVLLAASEQSPTEQTESAAAETAGRQAASDAEATKQGISKLAAVALLLTLVALTGLGYGFNQLQQLQIRQDQQVTSLKEQLHSSDAINRQLQQQNGQILGELNQVRTSAKEQQQHVDELQNRLAKAMQQVSKLGTDTRKDWLLAEVEYLLRLANQRVQLERTATGALGLLRSADQILKETDDVSIYPVRKALAQDLLKLEAVPELDVDGLFIKLVAINSEVDNLQLLPATDKHQLPELLQSITPKTVSTGWQQGLESSWTSAMDKLGKLIVIRHRDDPVTPLLSPEQHYFLTQNLHLMLEQTQLALLQGKQEAYDTGLAKSKVWIQTYFRQNDSTVQALLDNLSQLQGINIAPKLPDISDSLKALKRYLSELHNLPGAA
jgi:uroporphyrin-3 C-methyltransferase